MSCSFFSATGLWVEGGSGGWEDDLNMCMLVLGPDNFSVCDIFKKLLFRTTVDVHKFSDFIFGSIALISTRFRHSKNWSHEAGELAECNAPSSDYWFNFVGIKIPWNQYLHSSTGWAESVKASRNYIEFITFDWILMTPTIESQIRSVADISEI